MTRGIKWHNVFDILESLLRSGSYGRRIWTSCEIKEEDITIDNKTLNEQPVKGKFDLLILGYDRHEDTNSKYPKRIFHPRENVLLVSNHLKDKYLYLLLENMHTYIKDILDYKRVTDQKIKSYKRVLQEAAPNCQYVICENCGFDFNKEKRDCPYCNLRYYW